MQYFMIIPPNFFWKKDKNKAEFKCLDDSEVLSSDFPGLETSAASMTSMASNRKGAKIQYDFVRQIFFRRSDISPEIIEFKNREDSEVLSSDFPSLIIFLDLRFW